MCVAGRSQLKKTMEKTKNVVSLYKLVSFGGEEPVRGNAKTHARSLNINQKEEMNTLNYVK
jgi:hypothetical protein